MNLVLIHDEEFLFQTSAEECPFFIYKDISTVDKFVLLI